MNLSLWHFNKDRELTSDDKVGHYSGLYTFIAWYNYNSDASIRDGGWVGSIATLFYEYLASVL